MDVRSTERKTGKFYSQYSVNRASSLDDIARRVGISKDPLWTGFANCARGKG